MTMTLKSLQIYNMKWSILGHESFPSNEGLPKPPFNSIFEYFILEHNTFNQATLQSR